MERERESERSLLVWSEDYRVGVDDIDDQHRELFNLVNRLRGAVAEGGDGLRTVFEELERYTFKHFTDEEALMMASGYPGFVEHARSHARFVEFVARERQKFLDGTVPGPGMLDFLNEWLVRHIERDDQLAADFYLDRMPPRSWFDRIFGRR